MRAVVQRVTFGSVAVDGQVVGQIDRGLVVFLGVGQDDAPQDAEYIASKLAGLRIFADEQGKMNLSVEDIGGEILMISQFTLHGDARRGRRPSYSHAASPDLADALYEHCIATLRAAGIRVATGVFQAMMQVVIHNDGPVTILLDSKRLF
ncbi:MAG: D-aminoacyl-tRNA deacylase [Bacillota bacterium]|jgi:D-tyrosyl-tRNA(Tyr) deacylase